MIELAEVAFRSFCWLMAGSCLVIGAALICGAVESMQRRETDE